MGIKQVTSFGNIYKHDYTIPVTDRWLKPIVLRLCHKYNVRKVLDIGCGNGTMCRQKMPFLWTTMVIVARYDGMDD